MPCVLGRPLRSCPGHFRPCRRSGLDGGRRDFGIGAGAPPLGGELPTARFCGLVHPSDFSGLTLQTPHVNHWGELTQLRAVGSSPPSSDVNVGL